MKCVQELKGPHTDTITCMIEAGFGTVWSADRNNCLCVWSQTPPKQKQDELETPKKRKLKRHKRVRSKSFNK